MPSELPAAFADSLRKTNVLSLPSCVIVEMMTHLYSQIFAINLSGDLADAARRILPLLARMRENLRAAGEAYASRIRFFVGDWNDDKIRARRQFFNIMSRLGSVSSMVGHDDRDRLYGEIEGLTEEWIALDRTMDAQAKGAKCDSVCRYFRNRNPSTWRQTMANIILTLDEEAEYGEGQHLVLLCYDKMRRLLLSTIDATERKRGRPGRFRADRIIAVSDGNVPFSCPTCLEMADIDGSGEVDEKYPEEVYARTILRMEGASCPMRPKAVREKPAGSVSSRLAQPEKGGSPAAVMGRLRARLQGVK